MMYPSPRMIWNSLSSRVRLVAFFVVIVTLLFTLYQLPLSVPNVTSKEVCDCERPVTTTPDESVSRPPKDVSLPSEYAHVSDESPFCAERFGRPYLKGFQASVTEYCTADSSSKLTCFHSQTAQDARVDSFCIGQPAAFSATENAFMLDCEPRELSGKEIANGIPAMGRLPSYWYDTGPGHVVQNFVKTGRDLDIPSPSRNFTVLLKREGALNLWHSLMEIFSLTMTLDILRITTDSATGTPLFTLDDVANTQVVVLDDMQDGPYFDLWTMFAERPVVRLKDLTESPGLENIIIPLAGGSNPLWQGDWEIHDCARSDLLRVFTRRVFEFYGLETSPTRDGPLVVTFIDRRGTRRLIDQDAHLDSIRNQLPNVTVQSIDFEAIPFKEQLRVITDTDVLVGVHGAGLTHGMFLGEGSTMVEILAPDLDHKGFRNLAGLLGHSYFSAHGSVPPSSKRDWQSENVFIEDERFSELVTVAVKSMYNKGSRNHDVN